MSLYEEQNNPYFDIILASIFGVEFVLRVISSLDPDGLWQRAVAGLLQAVLISVVVIRANMLATLFTFSWHDILAETDLAISNGITEYSLLCSDNLESGIPVSNY
jgi:hypothetical protein